MKDIIKEIIKFKNERQAVIVAHNYQRQEVQEIADFCGDSLELARIAAELKEQTIVFCGVKFMAETAKVVSPDKTVLLPVLDAGCPMANMISPKELIEFKRQHPKAVVATYVNSTTAIKALSDICVTSGNALTITQNIDAEEIIMAPDKNLAHYCSRFTKKKIIPWNGYCSVHARFSAKDLLETKKIFPDAPSLVHPECDPSVVDVADHCLSTSGMLKFVEKENHAVYIIGTEEGLVSKLSKIYPNRRFVSIGSAKTCVNMKKTHLSDILESLKHNKNVISIPEDVAENARKAIDAMLKF